MFKLMQAYLLRSFQDLQTKEETRISRISTSGIVVWILNIRNESYFSKQSAKICHEMPIYQCKKYSVLNNFEVYMHEVKIIGYHY